MQRKRLIIWLVSLIVVTICLPLWRDYGMNTTYRIGPQSNFRMVPVSDKARGGNSVATLKRTHNTLILDCALKNGYSSPYCEIQIFLSHATRGIDLSRYGSVELRIKTAHDEAYPVRVFLRNYNSAYSNLSDPDTLKVNQIQYVPPRESYPFIFPLHRLHVSAWWVRWRNVPFDQTGVDISNVTKLVVSIGTNLKPGHYQISVGPIVFHGKWLSGVQLLYIILGLWIASCLIYLFSLLLSDRRHAQAMRARARALEDVNAALKIERHELKQKATHDPLTGLLNRMGLRAQLHDLYAGAKDGKKALSIVFIDIDFFKRINDTHGHFVGDEILAEFARLMISQTRSTDTLCRWGGEEFILICDSAPLSIAVKVADKLRLSLNHHHWPHDIKLTASFGVAQLQCNENLTAVLDRADALLYRAKDAGRNCVMADPM